MVCCLTFRKHLEVVFALKYLNSRQRTAKNLLVMDNFNPVSGVNLDREDVPAGTRVGLYSKIEPHYWKAL